MNFHFKASNKLIHTFPSGSFHAVRLPNGNTLVNVVSRGNIFELNSNREIVWEYEIPLNGDTPVNQGNNPNNNGNFRAYKFSEDFSGFDGIDLSPGEIIENDNNPLVCNIVSGLDDLEIDHLQCFYQNETQNIIVEQVNPSSFKINFYNWQGQLLFAANGNQAIESFPFSPLVDGIYVIQVIDHEGAVVSKKVWIN